MAKADLERAKELFPSCAMDMGDWLTFFGTAPGLRAMGRILYDVFDEVLSREERDAGQRRIGRRPARSAVSLAQVMAVVRPDEFTNDPFPIALKKLLRGRSQRAFARKVPIHQSYLSRLLAGEREPDLELMEALAHAASVGPWHFPEWRAQYVAALITEVMIEQPHLGIGALKVVRVSRERAKLLRSA